MDVVLIIKNIDLATNDTNCTERSFPAGELGAHAIKLVNVRFEDGGVVNNPPVKLLN